MLRREAPTGRGEPASAFKGSSGNDSQAPTRRFDFLSYFRLKLERLGLIEPTDEPGKYSVSLQDGNFPGWTVLTYRSTAMPDAVIGAYAKRCQDLGLKITRGPESKADDGKDNGA